MYDANSYALTDRSGDAETATAKAAFEDHYLACGRCNHYGKRCNKGRSLEMAYNRAFNTRHLRRQS